MTTSIIAIRRVPFWTQILIAALTTTFLFFIDEGAYNFKWTLSPGNWIPFAAYTGFLLLGQLIADRFIFKKYRGDGRTILTAIVGIVLGLIIPFFIGYVIVPFLSH